MLLGDVSEHARGCSKLLTTDEPRRAVPTPATQWFQSHILSPGLDLHSTARPVGAGVVRVPQSRTVGCGHGNALSVSSADHQTVPTKDRSGSIPSEPFVKLLQLQASGRPEYNRPDQEACSAAVGSRTQLEEAVMIVHPPAVVHALRLLLALRAHPPSCAIGPLVPLVPCTPHAFDVPEHARTMNVLVLYPKRLPHRSEGPIQCSP